MKQIVLGLGLIVALAACGGGSGSGPIPNPVQSTAPVAYTSYLRFVGALAGAQVQSDLRRAQSVSPMSAATPIPIMVVEPPVANEDTSVYGGEVEAVVSPMPSSSPTVSFSQNNSGAQLFTPQPIGTPQPLPTGVIAQEVIDGTNVVQTQSAGTATATIGSPVNSTPSTPVYSYMSIDMSCVIGNFSPGAYRPPYEHHIGWKWDGTTWAPDDDATTADVYMDGPNCPDDPNPSESDYTVHIPGGDIRISTDTPFNSISASQWSNAETSYEPNANGMINPDGSVQCVVIGKTRDGSHIFKWDAANAGCMFGAIETSGSSVDGF